MHNITAFDAETIDQDGPVPYVLSAAGWQSDEPIPYALTASAWGAA